MVASKISDRVYLIDTQALGEKNTVAAYLVKGSKTALVDCGYASSAETVLQALTELNVSPADMDYVIPTHVHLDHAGAAGYLLDRMPRAKLIAQEKGVKHLVDPTRLVESATSVFGEALIKTYGTPKGIQADRITAVTEEMHLDIGGLSLTIVHAPGHAPHQVSVYVEEEKVLISADAVGIVYPLLGILIPTTPPPSLDPAELGRTAERLGQMDSKILLAPHFGARTDVKEVLAQTKSKTNDWVSLVRGMRQKGMSQDQMTRELKSMVSRESGLPEDRFPTYADISIRTNVMGITRYLEKNP